MIKILVLGVNLGIRSGVFSRGGFLQEKGVNTLKNGKVFTSLAAVK